MSASPPAEPAVAEDVVDTAADALTNTGADVESDTEAAAAGTNDAAPSPNVDAQEGGQLEGNESAAVPDVDAENMFGSDDDTPAPARTDRETREGGDDGRDEATGDGYVPATEDAPARIPSFKKRPNSGDPEDVDNAGEDDDDDDEDEEARRRRKKKKKDARRAAREAAGEEDEEDEPQLDAAARRRLEIEERIDAIGKGRRPNRRRKKGEAFDICARLRDRMLAAADKDKKANMNKMPATSKLAMLDEVVSALQNTTLWSSIIDNEVLKAVKEWLEPLPDRSLPAVGIQKAVFEVLPKMDLDTPTIREAGLGPIVLFYTKTKRVTPAITRQADALVQAWSRPIIKRPADFRSRYIATVDEVERADIPDEDEMQYDEDGELREPTRPIRPLKNKTKAQRFNVRKALEENRDRKGARLPMMQDVQYTVAPESVHQHRVQDTGYIARIQQDNKKFNRFTRQLKVGRGQR